jgi:hypothetical protein
MAHKGKATSDVTYNPDDGPEAYTNPAIHSRLSEYTAMAKEVHGPDYDPRTEDINGDVLMRVGGGKRHGRYWIADGAIDSFSTPTLSGMSKEHEREPNHTTSAGHLTTSYPATPGYSLSIHHSLIIIYLLFALS